MELQSVTRAYREMGHEKLVFRKEERQEKTGKKGITFEKKDKTD